MQIAFINIGIIILGVVAIYRIYSKYAVRTLKFMELMKNLSKLKTEDEQKTIKKDKTENFLHSINSYTSKIGFLKFTKKEQETIEYLAYRLELNWNGVIITDVYLTCLLKLSQLVYILICILLGLINLRLIVLMVLFRLLPNIVLYIFDLQVQDLDKEIESNFLEFYAPFYHTYKYPQNRCVQLSEICKEQYGISSVPIIHMMNLIRAESQISEEYALQQLQTRYKIPKVIRFANLLLPIITGKDVDLTMLEQFYNELWTERDVVNQERLERKKEKANELIKIPMALLVVVVVYWSLLTIMINK